MENFILLQHENIKTNDLLRMFLFSNSTVRIIADPIEKNSYQKIKEELNNLHREVDPKS